MNRSDIFRIILVTLILTPLIIIQIGPGIAPEWMSNRFQGIPLTVLVTVAWFISMMVMAVFFARGQVGEKSSSQGE